MNNSLSKTQQVNYVIGHADEEFDDFIEGQLLTETRKSGKALIQLVKAWCQLKKTMVEWECHGVIGAIEEYTFGSHKYSEKGSTLQIKIRKLATKYVDLKKKYISTYLN